MLCHSKVGKSRLKSIVQVAQMSIALLAAIRIFKIPHLPAEKLQIRIGLHTGKGIETITNDTFQDNNMFFYFVAAIQQVILFDRVMQIDRRKMNQLYFYRVMLILQAHQSLESLALPCLATVCSVIPWILQQEWRAMANVSYYQSNLFWITTKEAR